MKFDITEIKKISQPFLKKHGILKAAVFGSSVRGEADDGSDIDLLVELKEGSSLLDLVELKLELEEALDHKVDVLTFNSLNPLLKARVEKEAIRI